MKFDKQLVLLSALTILLLVPPIWLSITSTHQAKSITLGTTSATIAFLSFLCVLLDAKLTKKMNFTELSDLDFETLDASAEIKAQKALRMQIKLFYIAVCLLVVTILLAILTAVILFIGFLS